jgi:hypothetical protein
MTARKEPRRPSLATIVGSSLAVAAAGSLLAFSSLAEQAGLQGLATGGLQPAAPARNGGGGHAITLPAPSAEPPRDPRDALTDLVRDAIVRVDAPREVEPITFAVTVPAPPQRERADKKVRRPDPSENQAKVVVADPDVPSDDAETDGPPYGHAYGHYKDKHQKPEPARKPKPAKKHKPKSSSPGQPVYARTANEDAGKAKAPKAKAPKPPKMKKVDKAESPGNGHGKAKGHSKHSGNGKGKSKGKGHSKHGG